MHMQTPENNPEWLRAYEEIMYHNCMNSKSDVENVTGTHGVMLDH